MTSIAGGNLDTLGDNIDTLGKTYDTEKIILISGVNSGDSWTLKICTYSAAKRIDFSWTWYEKRKKARDEFA